MIKPEKLNIGDTIGVVAPSSPIIKENINDLKEAIKIVEKDGFKVKLSKNIYSNTNGYSATAKEKAQDINDMFRDKDVKVIWCAKGGENSNTTFEYLDFDLIKNNPKIICGFSDITSLINIIHERTGLITFHTTNFKTIATSQTNYAYEDVKKKFIKTVLELDDLEDYITIKDGIAEGELIGGNLSLINGMVSRKVFN